MFDSAIQTVSGGTPSKNLTDILVAKQKRLQPGGMVWLLRECGRSELDQEVSKCQNANIHRYAQGMAKEIRTDEIDAMRLKHDLRMARCYFNGQVKGMINVMLVAGTWNLRKWMGFLFAQIRCRQESPQWKKQPDRRAIVVDWLTSIRWIGA